MIALLGSTGMVGSAFKGELLKPKRHECDALKLESLQRYIARNKVYTIINCIGYCGHRDSKDKIKIHEDNVATTRNIALACRESGTRLIHFATSIAGYGSTYSQCKAYSEDIIRDYCTDYSLIRIPWMISKENDKGFLPVILNHIENDLTLKVYEETGSIGYTKDVANYIMKNLYTLPKEIDLCNSGILTRKEWAEEVAKVLGKRLKIELIDGMKKTKQFSGLDGKLRPWKKALRGCLCDKGYSLQS